MKRLLIPAMVAVAAVGLAGMATAGDYHVGATLVCGDCHVMHGTHAGSTSVTTTGHSSLLKASSVNGACLTCHEGRTDVPDVIGASANPPTNGRLAGALNAMSGHGYDNVDGYQEGDGHTLWSTDVPPGYTGTAAAPVSADGLECSDCHSVHGSANYRNMRSSTRTTNVWYNKTVTYSIGTKDNTKDVYEAAAHSYGWDNVGFMEPSPTASAYGAWCMTCHSQFHGDTTSTNIKTGGEVVRHPTAGVNVSVGATSQYNLHTHRVKLMDGTGTWDGLTANQTPSCFSCHKSHGNKNDSGLIWFIDNTQTGPGAHVAAGGITEEGDADASLQGGAYRDLCRQCHGQGSFPAGNPTNINAVAGTAGVPVDH